MITLDYIVDGTDEEKVQSGCTEKDLRLTTHYQMCYSYSLASIFVIAVFLTLVQHFI
jgi:hypothetical protein